MAAGTDTATDDSQNQETSHQIQKGADGEFFVFSNAPRATQELMYRAYNQLNMMSLTCTDTRDLCSNSLVLFPKNTFNVLRDNVRAPHVHVDNYRGLRWDSDPIVTYFHSFRIKNHGGHGSLHSHGFGYFIYCLVNFLNLN